MQKYNIFLSHHETETEIAQDLKRFLVDSSQDIEVDTYVQKTKPDANFRRWITESVKKSDMFMFLYTDDNRELSWVAHELGLFLGTHDEQKKTEVDIYPPIICIKSRDIKTMPAIMSHIAPISATDDDIRNFLQELLLQGVYTNRKILANNTGREIYDKIDDGAKNLAGMFSSKIHTEYFADRLIFTNITKKKLSSDLQDISHDFQVVRKEYNPYSNKEEKFVLDFSAVKIETNESMRKDLRLRAESCWGDLINLAKKSKKGDFGPSDRFDLPKEILDHASSGIVQDATSMILSEIHIEGKVFLPIISRVETQDRFPISYYLIMLPDPKSRPEKIVESPMLMEAFTKDLKLILLLKAARRFRWNILEPFIWEILRAIHAKEDLQPIFLRLQSALDAIEYEGAQDKIDDGNLAALEFPIEERNDLKELWLKYASLRVEINNAIQKDNAKGVLEVLNKFQEMNRSFYATSLEVYKQLMINIPTLDEANKDWRDKYFS